MYMKNKMRNQDMFHLHPHISNLKYVSSNSYNNKNQNFIYETEIYIFWYRYKIKIQNHKWEIYIMI